MACTGDRLSVSATRADVAAGPRRRPTDEAEACFAPRSTSSATREPALFRIAIEEWLNVHELEGSIRRGYEPADCGAAGKSLWMGMVTVREVPSPVGLVIWMVPLRASTRSRRPVSPD